MIRPAARILVATLVMVSATPVASAAEPEQPAFGLTRTFAFDSAPVDAEVADVVGDAQQDLIVATGGQANGTS